MSGLNSKCACATRQLFYLSDVRLRAIQTSDAQFKLATVAPDKVSIGATLLLEVLAIFTKLIHMNKLKLNSTKYDQIYLAAQTIVADNLI